jgi:hypothetical protein
MQTAFPAHERPAKNVLTAELRYVTPTRKRAVSALSSARPVRPSIRPSTRSLPQLITGRPESTELPDSSSCPTTTPLELALSLNARLSSLPRHHRR